MINYGEVRIKSSIDSVARGAPMPDTFTCLRCGRIIRAELYGEKDGLRYWELKKLKLCPTGRREFKINLILCSLIKDP